jgi:cytochrome P450 family 26 subfamily A
MWNILREELVFVGQNYYDITIVLFLSIGLTYIASRAWKRATTNREDIPGQLGLPLIGETFSFLSATNSTRGCYDFVRLRRLW